MRGTVTPDRTAAAQRERPVARTHSRYKHTNPLPIIATPFSSFMVCGMRYDPGAARGARAGGGARGGFRFRTIPHSTNSHGWASALGAALALVLHSMTLLPGRSPWRYFYATLSFDFS